MKKLITLSALLVITMLVALSCSPGFIDQDLQGMVNGVEWTYASGFAEESFSDSTKYSIDLYAGDPSGGDVCATGAFSHIDDYVMFSVPKEVGVYDLGLSQGQTVTIYAGGTNYICVEGAVEIVSVTDTEIVGKLNAKSDNDNYVNGNFTVTLCASTK